MARRKTATAGEQSPPKAATDITRAFECDRAALVAALRRVKRAIDMKIAVPILSFAHVSVGDDAIRIVGTDYLVGLRETVPATVERPGEFLLPMALLDLLSASDAERVSLKHFSTCRIQVVLGRRSGEYASAVVDEYPALPSCSKWDSVDGRVLDLIAQVKHCQSEDKARPHLCGVALEVSGGTLSVVATDGHAMGMRSMPSEGEFSLLLPTPFVGLLSQFDGAQPFEIGRNGPTVFARQGATTILCKLGDRPFPPWRQIMSNAKAASFECDRAELLSAVRALASVEVDFSSRIWLSVEESETVLSAWDKSSTRSARETIPSTLKGLPFEGAINGRYLLNALSATSSDRVRLDAEVPKDWMLSLFVADERGGEIVMGMSR